MNTNSPVGRKEPLASKTLRLWLLVSVLVALLVRAPGVFWGANFPFGWWGHHVDEYLQMAYTETLINPYFPLRWSLPMYPKGMGAHAAVPLIGWRALHGNLFGPRPEPMVTILIGRVISVLYGTATVLVLFLLVRRLCPDARVAVAAAWIMALGGLHVSQSHFFVADAANLFWILMTLYCLARAMEEPNAAPAHWLNASAFCSGIAFGIKLGVVAVPALFLVALLHKPRWSRCLYAAVFFAFGVVLVSLGTYSLYDLARQRDSDPYVFNRLMGAIVYAIELPSVASFPLTAISLAGTFLLLRRRLALSPALVVVLFRMDHFPRHLVTFLPVMAGVAAWTLIRCADHLQARRIHPAWVLVPFYAYLALFVYDGERVFWWEPRNRAANWLMTNVPAGATVSWPTHDGIPGYKQVLWPRQGRPDVVVIEMHYANHFLSGVGWKNSFPQDHRAVFSVPPQQEVRQYQDLFQRSTEYEKRAVFTEGYFMPEFQLADRLVGNTARNFVAEVVVFVNKANANL